MRAVPAGRGYALDPHDCVVFKVVAGREKDHAFANALIKAGLISQGIVAAADGYDPSRLAAERGAAMVAAQDRLTAAWPVRHPPETAPRPSGRER